MAAEALRGSEPEEVRERRGYLLNELTGVKEYFVLRGGVLRIRQKPRGADIGSIYLAYGSQVSLLANNVLEIHSRVPYMQEYILAAPSENEAEGWHDAIQGSIRSEQLRMQRLTELLENGCMMHKYNYSNSKRSRRYFWVERPPTSVSRTSHVADAGRELCWGRAKGEDTQKVNLRECIGIIYGPMTTTFQRTAMVEDPSWTCFSLLFMGRTLDLAVAGDLQVHAWFLGMQHLISRHGIGSMPMMSDAAFVARKVQYKLMDAAHRHGLVLGRYLVEQVKAVAAGKPPLSSTTRGGARNASNRKECIASAQDTESTCSTAGRSTAATDASEARTSTRAKRNSMAISGGEAEANDRTQALRARLLQLQSATRERTVQAQAAEATMKRVGAIPPGGSSKETVLTMIRNEALQALRARCASLESNTQQLSEACEATGPQVKASEKADRSVRRVQVKLEELEAKKASLVAEVNAAKEKAEATSGARENSSLGLREVKMRGDELQNRVHQLEQQLLEARGRHDAEAEAKNKAQDEAIAAMEQERLSLSQKRQAVLRDYERLVEAERQSRDRLEKMAATNKKLDRASDPLKKAVAKLREEQRKALSDIRDVGSGFGSEIQTIIDATAKVGVVQKDLEHNYQVAMEERKKLHNLVLDLKGNIRVFVRVRPINAREIATEPEGEPTTSFQEDTKIGIYDGTHARRKWFDFDQVFAPGTTTTQVFEEAKPLATSVLDGFNVCVFAYGQTGSGKTHTMTGNAKDPGLNTRVLTELFKIRSERSGEYEIDISLAITEIYNETIRDLLAPSGKKLDVKMNQDGSVSVPGLQEEKVKSVAEVMKCINDAAKNRATSQTEMNSESSRSHSIVTVRTKCTLKGADTYAGKIHLIDLAGSENVNKSGVSGQGMREAQNINKSLSALGDVIQSLVAKNPHTPYRNSKLTMMLKDSLGGDSKTLMIVQSSPAQTNVTETLSSLNFAARARNVELGKAKRNVAS
eukprot:TRINITY_DN48710_c0_g1_i1.p1 TRINITY_DN48710_c0_g1~~TRINITY_DN48710_c0_g1_i1.p1  ORF type:complete len:984 (-),score=196.70 TRINITY_DN48710_c0_g1_i1:68-3019(-)